MRYFASSHLDTCTHGHTNRQLHNSPNNRAAATTTNCCCTVFIICRSVPHFKMQSCEKYVDFHVESHWTDTFEYVARYIYPQQSLDKYCSTIAWLSCNTNMNRMWHLSSPRQSHGCQIISGPLIMCDNSESGSKEPAPGPAFVLPSGVKRYWFTKEVQTLLDVDPNMAESLKVVAGLLPAVAVVRMTR